MTSHLKSPSLTRFLWMDRWEPVRGFTLTLTVSVAVAAETLTVVTPWAGSPVTTRPAMARVGATMAATKRARIMRHSMSAAALRTSVPALNDALAHLAELTAEEPAPACVTHWSGEARRVDG